MIVGFDMAALMLLLIILRMLPAPSSHSATGWGGKSALVVGKESGCGEAYTQFDHENSCHKVATFKQHESAGASQSQESRECGDAGGGRDARTSLNCISVQSHVICEPTGGDQMPAAQPKRGCHEVLQVQEQEIESDVDFGKVQTTDIQSSEEPEIVSSSPPLSQGTVAAIYYRCAGLFAGLVKVWAIVWADGLASLTFFITLYVICIGTALVRLEVVFDHLCGSYARDWQCPRFDTCDS
jgi:hypothetical protein